jgi:hypothetical protein
MLTSEFKLLTPVPGGCGKLGVKFCCIIGGVFCPAFFFFGEELTVGVIALVVAAFFLCRFRGFLLFVSSAGASGVFRM